MGDIVLIIQPKRISLFSFLVSSGVSRIEALAEGALGMTTPMI